MIGSGVGKAQSQQHPPGRGEAVVIAVDFAGVETLLSLEATVDAEVDASALAELEASEIGRASWRGRVEI